MPGEFRIVPLFFADCCDPSSILCRLYLRFPLVALVNPLGGSISRGGIKSSQRFTVPIKFLIALIASGR